MSKRQQRCDDARLELYIEHDLLQSLGLLDPDQPTRWAHYQYQKRERQQMEGPFTPDERRQIRTVLGLAAIEEGAE